MIPKFRSWVENVRHPKFSFMQYEPEFNGEINKIFEKNGEIQHGVKVSYMQSTGLKDKNGVEIFEGDIVKVSNHPFQKNDNGIGIEINGNYVIGRSEYSLSWLAGNLILAELKPFIEVIGNIYENPELLEVEG
jgi:uncharacterized phage protein (TIGR01671 family)